jgi:hypothetical protein
MILTSVALFEIDEAADLGIVDEVVSDVGPVAPPISREELNAHIWVRDRLVFPLGPLACVPADPMEEADPWQRQTSWQKADLMAEGFASRLVAEGGMKYRFW